MGQLDDLDFADELALLSHTHQHIQDKTGTSAQCSSFFLENFTRSLLSKQIDDNTRFVYFLIQQGDAWIDRSGWTSKKPMCRLSVFRNQKLTLRKA